MESITKASSRHYKISDAWLEKYKNDETRYVDMDEIRTDTTSSQYLQDLVDMGINVDFVREQRKAAFWINGMRTNSNGANINRVLEEDSNLDADVATCAGYTKHEERVRRVYAHNTTARGIEILGVGTRN